MIPYTYWRIKDIFQKDYDLTLVSAFVYKGSRYNQPKKYHLKKSDGSLELSYITLDSLREFLTKEGYSLKDE